MLTDGVFPFVVGGMQKHSYYLVKYLARLGVYVDLYFTAGAEQVKEQQDKELFSDKELAFIRLIPVTPSPAFRFPGHYIYESYLNSKNLWLALQKNLQLGIEPVNFIYAQGFAGWKTMQVRKQDSSIPQVGVNFHGFEMWQMPATLSVRLQHLMLRPFVKANVKLADAVLLLGTKLSPVVDNFLKQDKVKLVSANGVTHDWLGSVSTAKSRPLRFVFLGRYERRKGIEELHATIKRLSPQFAFNVDVVGPIPDHLRMRSDKVKYWGMVRDEEQIRAILNGADVLVCPSYAEGMPTVILEAMASGLAVIATNVGAVGDLVSSENGWIIPPGQMDALYKAMVEAITLKRESLERKMAASYAKVKQKYLWHRVAENTISEIESVLA